MTRSFIRPELAARLRPWRELAAAALTFAAGGWLFSLGGLLFRPLGAGVMLAAALWALGAWRRRRAAWSRCSQSPLPISQVLSRADSAAPQQKAFLCLPLSSVFSSNNRYTDVSVSRNT